MPKRSNVFQKIIHLAQVHLAVGATVTESKLLTDLITGRKREVDVCIETSIAEHKVMVCIECRDHRRPADVTWVDAMKCKHERLPTHSLVLVSRKGFTPEAVEVARISSIETLAFEQIDEASMARLFGVNGSLWAKGCTLTVTNVVIGIMESAGLPAEKIEAVPDNRLFTSDGTDFGTVKELVEFTLHNKTLVEQLLRQADSNHKYYEARWDIPPNTEGKRLCLQKMDTKVLRPIEYVLIKGPVTITIARFNLRGGDLGSIQIAWGTGKLFEKNALLVVTKDAEGKQKLTLTVGENVPKE